MIKSAIFFEKLQCLKVSIPHFFCFDILFSSRALLVWKRGRGEQLRRRRCNEKKVQNISHEKKIRLAKSKVRENRAVCRIKWPVSRHGLTGPVDVSSQRRMTDPNKGTDSSNDDGKPSDQPDQINRYKQCIFVAVWFFTNPHLNVEPGLFFHNFLLNSSQFKLKLSPKLKHFFC